MACRTGQAPAGVRRDDACAVGPTDPRRRRASDHGRQPDRGQSGPHPLHHWVELADGRRIDLRARLWLGDGARVPHGIVDAPDVHASYVGQRSDLTCGPIVFWALTDTTMDAFGPAPFLKGRPERGASGTDIVAPVA